MWDPYADFESVVLPNGLTVYAAQWPGRAWQRAHFMIHSGAGLDTVGKEGTAHLLEHVVSENTGRSRQEIWDFFEQQGGTAMLGETGPLGTRYHFASLAQPNLFREGLNIFGDMLTSAKIVRAVEREIGIVIEEYNRSFSDPWRGPTMGYRSAALYGNTWPSRCATALGNLESIPRITQDDLQKYYDARYVAANMTIVGLGGMPTAEFFDLVAGSPFGKVQRGNRAPQPDPAVTFEKLPENIRRVNMREFVPNRETGIFTVCAKFSIEKCPPAIFTIFRRMIDDKLFEEVRNKRQWTYAINSGSQFMGTFAYVYVSSDSVKAEAFPAINDVVASCIRETCNDGALFNKKQQEAVAEIVMDDPNGKRVVNGCMDDIAENGRIFTLAEVLAERQAVTFDDLRGLWEYLQPERVWACNIYPH